MFDRLPRDLAITILSEWLEANSLTRFISRMDVALCTHSFRTEWFELLALIPTIVEEEPMIGFNDSSLLVYIQWIHRRRLRVNLMEFIINAVYTLEHVDPLQLQLPTTSLRFSDSENELPNGFKQCLAMFPQLTSLEYDNAYMTDTQFREFRHLQCPLQILKIGKCDEISPSTVKAIVVKLSQTIHTLHCAVLNDAAVECLTNTCHGFKDIFWSTNKIKSATCIVEFCKANPRLENLGLSVTAFNKARKVITTKTILTVALHCKHLKRVDVDSKYENVSEDILSGLLNHDNAIEFVKWFAMAITVVRPKGKEKYCELSLLWEILEDEYDQHSILPFVCLHCLNDVTLPVRTIYTDREVTVYDKDLVQIGEQFGHSLEELVLFNVATDVKRVVLQSLLSKCPKLSILRLPYQAKTFEDEDVRNLPHQCPLLINWKIACPNVTDSAMIDCLRKFAVKNSGTIQALDLCWCSKLTDATLTAIEKLFPRIVELGVAGTGVSNEAVLSFVSRRKVPLDILYWNDKDPNSTNVLGWAVKKVSCPKYPTPRDASSEMYYGAALYEN